MSDTTSTPVRIGQVTRTEQGFRVVVGGAPKAPQWCAGYTARVGDYVACVEYGDLAFVLGHASATPLPKSGLVAGPPADGRVPIEAAGQVYDCRHFADGVPALGERVAIYWSDSDPVIFPGTLATVPGEAIPLPPPPSGSGAPTSGSDVFYATAAGSQRPSGWEWGTVKQGAYGSSPTNRGAWFYGAGVTRLAGVRVSRIRLRLGPRDGSVGNYNSTLTGHFYVASGSGPNAWNALTGVYDHPVNPVPSQLQDIDLPTSWAGLLVAGNGIGIAGNPYLGIKSGGQSGALIIDWSS